MTDRRRDFAGVLRTDPPIRRHLEKWLGGAGVLLAVVFYLVWEYAHRGVYAYSTAAYPFDDADEWRYTACSRLVEHGYSLFDQVFSAQPPLFFLSLASGMRVFGDSITGARGTEIVFGAIALAATAWTAWELAGPIAAGVAAGVLAVSPGFLLYAHAVEAEVPMMSLVTVSLALALIYRRRDGVQVLVLSGLALAAATLIKFFALEAALPALWLLATRHGATRGFLRASAIWGMAAALPLVGDFALISPGMQWSQVVELHNRAAALQLPGLISPFTIIRQFASLDAGLSVLAAGGLALLIANRRSADAVFLALWTVGTTIMLLIFRPLFPHHAAILSASLAVCAGAGMGAVIDAARDRHWLAGWPIGLLLLIYGAALPGLIHADRHSLVTSQPSSVTVLASYLDRTTRAGDVVAVDNVQIAERAHRFEPPPLCDPSNVRLLAGFMTAQDLIAATRQYHARFVIAVGNYNAAPAYIRWVHAHFSAVRVPGAGVVYRAKSMSHP